MESIASPHVTEASPITLELRRFVAEHRMTRYTVHVGKLPSGAHLILVSPDNNNRGQYVAILTETIAWTYLAEKLELREGDREGYTAVLAAAGIEVF